MAVKEPIFTKVKFICPKIETEIEVDWKNVFISSRESDCSKCGSHGDVTIEVTCVCSAKSHSTEVNSW